MELNTFIISPRRAAGGMGAWAGTVGDLLNDAQAGPRARAMLEEEGRLPADPDRRKIAAALTWGHLTRLLDDPDVIVTGMEGNALDSAVEAQDKVTALEGELAAARASRDGWISRLVDSGMSMYQVAKATGLSNPRVKQIVNRAK